MSETIEKQSAGGIVYADGKVLAIRAIPQNVILFPKGTIEADETPEQTAIREVFEETGYKTIIKAPLGSITYEFDEEDGKHYHKTVHHPETHATHWQQPQTMAYRLNRSL